MMMSRFAMFFGGSRDNDRGGNPIALLATMILAPIAAMLIQAAISRSREFDADAGGAAIAGQPARAGQRAAEDRGGVARRCRSTPTQPQRTCSSSSRSPPAA